MRVTVSFSFVCTFDLASRDLSCLPFSDRLRTFHLCFIAPVVAASEHRQRLLPPPPRHSSHPQERAQGPRRSSRTRPNTNTRRRNTNSADPNSSTTTTTTSRLFLSRSRPEAMAAHRLPTTSPAMPAGGRAWSPDGTTEVSGGRPGRELEEEQAGSGAASASAGAWGPCPGTTTT